jgi:hypothetical protein
MKRGAILETARKDSAGAFMGGMILLVVCAGTLAINWKYVYNFIAGPVPFTAALSANPGAHEWVTASGTLLDTGGVEQTTLRLRSLPLIKATTTTARYAVMAIEGRLLLVKVDTDFSGNFVSGRLTPLPADLSEVAKSGKVYPSYIEATIGYRWDFNLFVLGATLLLPLVVLVTVSAARSKMDLQRHHAIARLKRYGNPLDVVTLIETELSSTRVANFVSPLWIGSTWAVALTPQLRIYKLSDIVAVALIVTPSKDAKPAKHAVRFWIEGNTLADTIEMSEKEAGAVVTTLAAKLPGVVTNDADAFSKRWLRDPDGCVRDAKARRSLPRSA